uniref:Uncharacterized protein n=1 Tax=Lepeophtheirus salmonis TaxID=72036 RepID=A0A0K2T0I6_LEPSM
MWVSFPNGMDTVRELAEYQVHGPNNGNQIECHELPGFIEFGMLTPTQMKLPVHFVKNILLENGVHHDADQQVEKYSTGILEPSSIHYHFSRRGSGKVRSSIRRNRDIMLNGNEKRRRGTRRLEHQSHYENHCKTSNNIRMILDHEFMTQDWRILRASSLLHHHCRSHLSAQLESLKCNENVIETKLNYKKKKKGKVSLFFRLRVRPHDSQS